MHLFSLGVSSVPFLIFIICGKRGGIVAAATGKHNGPVAGKTGEQR